MGVWIEIMCDYQKYESYEVTPFMGVWIEIAGILKKSRYQLCHSLHGSVD